MAQHILNALDTALNDLYQAVALGDVGLVQNTIRRNNMHLQDYGQHHNQSVLHVAISNGNTAVLESLLVAGARADVVDSNGYTPLQFAINKGEIGMARILINHTLCDINISSKLNGFTFIHLCSEIQDSDALEWAFQYSTARQTPLQLNKSDRVGMTAMHRAAYRNEGISHLRIIEQLSDAGTSRSATDFSGRTAHQIYLDGLNGTKVNNQIVNLLRVTNEV